MKGINKVSRFYKHTLFSILFGWQWYSVGYQPQYSNWKMMLIEWRTHKNLKKRSGSMANENFLQWCGVATCEAHQRNEISAFACVSRHLLVHWVLADESFMNALEPLIETRFLIDLWSATCIVTSWCMQSSQEEENWRKKVARNKRKNLQILASKGRIRKEFLPSGNRRCKTMPENLWFRVSWTSSSPFFTAPISNVLNGFSL